MEIFFEGGADFIGGDVKGGKRTADCNFSGGRVQAGVDQPSIIKHNTHADPLFKTSQELRMLSSVTINCQKTRIVMNSGSQLS